MSTNPYTTWRMAQKSAYKQTPVPPVPGVTNMAIIADPVPDLPPSDPTGRVLVEEIPDRPADRPGYILELVLVADRWQWRQRRPDRGDFAVSAFQEEHPGPAGSRPPASRRASSGAYDVPAGWANGLEEEGGRHGD